MPLRRRPAGRMVRTMGRTAVVAGTATAVSGRVARRQQRRAMADSQLYEAQQPAAPPPAPAPVAPAPAPAPVAQAPSPPAAAPAMNMDDKLEALERLASLKEQGILTDDEFTAQKAKILAG